MTLDRYENYHLALSCFSVVITPPRSQAIAFMINNTLSGLEKNS